MNKYSVKKERIDEDTYKVTYTARIRKCSICSNIRKAKDISIVKYPIIHKDMGRLIMTKKVCTECYDGVKEILDNLKYN